MSSLLEAKHAYWPPCSTLTRCKTNELLLIIKPSMLFVASLLLPSTNVVDDVAGREVSFTGRLLCNQVISLTGGTASTLHTKYISEPSRMALVSILLPSSSFTLGESEGVVVVVVIDRERSVLYLVSAASKVIEEFPVNDYQLTVDAQGDGILENALLSSLLLLVGIFALTSGQLQPAQVFVFGSTN